MKVITQDLDIVVERKTRPPAGRPVPTQPASHETRTYDVPKVPADQILVTCTLNKNWQF